MTPPRLARRLLELVAPAHLRDAYLDDLDELHVMEVRRRGRTAAALWYFARAVVAVPTLLRIRRRPARQRTRPKETGMTFETLSRNLRHGTRVLIKAPGFTVAAVVTLALGIGANTAIFSLVKTVMLRPLPYGNPEQLVIVWSTINRRDMTHLSAQEIVSYGEESASFAQVAGYQESNANLTGGQEPERVRAAFVSGNLFETLEVGAILGRAFVPADSDPTAPPIALLSHGLWQRRFGGAPDVIGQSIEVNGRPRTVVGVMPPAFRLPLDYRADRPNEIWMPQLFDRANLGQWGNRSFFGIARLKPDATASSATSELSVIAARWVQAGFIRDSGDSRLNRSAIPLQEFVTGDVRRPLLILLGAVGVVLLIACANVVNLLLARADARRREIALRAAVGAKRGDIVGQLLTESVLLATAGGAIGILLARGAMELLKTLRPAGVPRIEEAAIDPSTLVFTAALSMLTGLVFGVLPAVQLSRQGFAGVLNQTGRGSGPGKVRLAVRRSLVVAQLAFSVVLVVGAGLLLRSLIELNRIDLGFDATRVLTAQLQLPTTDYPDAQKVVEFYRQLTARLEQLPGVVAAGSARVLPLARTIGDWSITIENRPTGPNENPNGDYQAVTPGYFKAMATTLISGRLLTDADREDAPPVVVINDTMAGRYWPGHDPLGKRFQMGGTGSTLPMMTIVGVVRTSRHNAVVEEPRAEMYLPHAQVPQTAGAPIRGAAIVLKTQGEPLALAEPLRQTIRSMDRNLPVAEVQTMEQVTATALAGPRFAAFLLGLFAALALTLAAIGTYATISLLVAERSHEIGIRIALGAERRAIVGWVLGEGLALAGFGIAAGISGALLLTRVLEALLYGVGAFDAMTFTVVPLILAIVALIASVNPARRAASLDPVSTLRRG